MAGGGGGPDRAADFLGDDPKAAFADSAREADAVLPEEGALQLTCRMPFGEVPGTVAAGMRCVDLLVHTWDLAKATRQPTAFDPELCQTALTMARARLGDGPRPSGAPVGPAVEIPAAAPACDRSAADMGRRPSRNLSPPRPRPPRLTLERPGPHHAAPMLPEGGRAASVDPAPRLLTYQDLLDTPDDGRRYEIIGGRAVVSASPILKHKRVSGRLFDLLLDVERAGFGVVFSAPTDVELEPHEIVVPGLVVVLAARPHILGRQKIEGTPDFIVDVVSPSTGRRDQGEKRDLYARTGVPEYWLVDPERETARALSLADGAHAPIPAEGTVVRSRVLPAFAVGVAALFAGLR